MVLRAVEKRAPRPPTTYKRSTSHRYVRGSPEVQGSDGSSGWSLVMNARLWGVPRCQAPLDVNPPANRVWEKTKFPQSSIIYRPVLKSSTGFYLICDARFLLYSELSQPLVLSYLIFFLLMAFRIICVADRFARHVALTSQTKSLPTEQRTPILCPLLGSKTSRATLK